MADVNLPVPQHQREQNTALVVPTARRYDIGGEDIRPPRLKFTQDTKTQAGDFGDVFVQSSSEDPSPVMVQENGGLKAGEMTPPLRFYVHAARRGINFHMPEHPDAGYNGNVLGPWGQTVAQFLATFPHAIDPRHVYRKYDFALTVPAYPDMFVLWILSSSAGGAAAAELNKQIQLLEREGKDPVETPFQVQARVTNKGNYVFLKYHVGFADVPEATREEDSELVQEHAALGAAEVFTSQRFVTDEADAPATVAGETPDLS